MLGEGGLGRFSLMFAVVDAISKIGNLGFDQSIVPLVARSEAADDREGSRRLYTRALRVSLAATLAVMVVAWPVLEWFARVREVDAFSGGGTLMLLALPGLTIARISTGVSRGLLAMRSEFYSRGLGETWITTGVFALAVALGLRDAAPSLAVAVGSTGGAFIAAALTLRSLVGSSGRGRGESVPDTPAMVRYSWPVAGASLLNNLALKVDVLLLGLFVGHVPDVTLERFGIFCAATEIAGGLRKVRQVFDPIFAPVAARRYGLSERQALRTTVEGPGRWVLAGQLPAVAFMALAAGPLMGIYGAGFRVGAPWVGMLAAAHAANSFAGLVETLLMIERPGLNLVNASVTIVVQVSVSLWLIPAQGVLGAVIGMSTGFVVQGVLRFVELKHVFGWMWPWRSLLRPLLVCGLAMVPALLCRWIWPQAELSSGLVFVAGYLITWKIVGADPVDQAILDRLLKRR